MSTMCGRCYDDVDETFNSDCDEKPETVSGAIGQYHCPDCGAMLIAGFMHPEICGDCLRREKVGFDL